jgi:hypothetical protein
MSEEANDDQIYKWCMSTPTVTLLKLYKQLYAMGFRISDVDHRIRQEQAKEKKKQNANE